MIEVMHYGFILAVICIVASGLLARVNSLTQARILAQAQAQEEATLSEVLSEGTHFEPVKSEEGEIVYYKAYNKDKKFVGVAFKAIGKGYSSEIETMVGLNKDGNLTAIKVINQNETPGLGSQVAEPAFSRQFSNKNLKTPEEVQAITGATISSKAVIESVKKKTQEIQGLLKNGK